MSAKGKARYAAEHPRTPLPGKEVEFRAVETEACRIIEVLEQQVTNVISEATHPRRPGLFSNPLFTSLRELGEMASNAANLLLRLRALCGEKNVEERHDRGQLDGLTPDEAKAVAAAAELARKRAMDARVVGARQPERCPRCGGQTYECKLDGDRRYLRYGAPSPARRCYDCDTVSPNQPPAPTAQRSNVRQLCRVSSPEEEEEEDEDSAVQGAEDAEPTKH
jgi:hypothetical protein